MDDNVYIGDDMIILDDESIDSVAGGIAPAVAAGAIAVGGFVAGAAAGYFANRDPRPSRQSGGGRSRGRR